MRLPRRKWGVVMGDGELRKKCWTRRGARMARKSMRQAHGEVWWAEVKRTAYFHQGDVERAVDAMPRWKHAMRQNADESRVVAL